MQLDLHVMRFDWAGDETRIGLGVADLAQCAEALGVRTLSFMDHYFQMDWMAPAEDPMLEGYTALGFVAGRTERLRLRLLVTGVTYRHLDATGQFDHRRPRLRVGISIRECLEVARLDFKDLVVGVLCA